MRAAIWSRVRDAVPPGQILPWWALVIRATLFPLDFFYWRMGQSRGYQWDTDSWIINGKVYSSAVFGQRGLLQTPGRTIRIVDNSDGVVTVEDAFDLLQHLARQREFSERTFGPGTRAQGVVDHIRKELREIEAAPNDLTEWIDVVILALDGAWRSGATPRQIIATLVAKQAKNERRAWPDWRTADPGKAIEHVRTGEGA